MHVYIKPAILQSKIELNIIRLLNKKPPECYAEINDEEVTNVYNNIIQKYSNKLNSFITTNLKNIIISIRSSYIKNMMINRHPVLKNKLDTIISDYDNNINILELSKKYNGSPLNIMRLILEKKYNKIEMKKMFKNPSKMNEHDKEQFMIAKNNDIYALINQDHIMEQAILFENKIQSILDKLDVKYKTQEMLVKEQIESRGRPYSTPDFLILSDFYINDIKINWIDAKNFYASYVNYTKKNIEEQQNKYINNYGSGCFIFNLGCNEKYYNKDILYLDYNSFNNLI